jgi:hypothetical protein
MRLGGQALGPKNEKNFYSKKRMLNVLSEVKAAKFGPVNNSLQTTKTF